MTAYGVHVLHVPGHDAVRDRCVSTMSAQMDNLLVHEDRHRRGVMWNWANSMLSMASQRQEWSVQLNDDMTLLPGWQDHLSEALAYSPSEIVGLAWLGTRRGTKAFEKGKAFALGHHLPSGYAVAYHKDVVSNLARFAHAMSLTDYRHDDAAMTTWAKHMGVTTALVSRSIFGQADSKSMLGHAQYGTSKFNIQDNPEGPSWYSGSVTDNYMAVRDDEEQILVKAAEAGWSAC